MKTLYFDCPMGAGGDMISASLFDLLENPEEFINQLNEMGLEDTIVELVEGFKNGIEGMNFNVSVDDEVEGEIEPHRHHHGPHEESECHHGPHFEREGHHGPHFDRECHHHGPFPAPEIHFHLHIHNDVINNYGSKHKRHHKKHKNERTNRGGRRMNQRRRRARARRKTGAADVTSVHVKRKK